MSWLEFLAYIDRILWSFSVAWESFGPLFLGSLLSTPLAFLLHRAGQRVAPVRLRTERQLRRFEIVYRERAGVATAGSLSSSQDEQVRGELSQARETGLLEQGIAETPR